MRIYNRTPFLRECFFTFYESFDIFGIKPGMSNIIFKESHMVFYLQKYH